MFFEGIRSERQLVRTAADRLSVRWYLGYDLHEHLPDHSSLTRIRDRYGVDTFKRFFEHIVEQCQRAGLVWGKELYFDGTQVEANADDDAMLPRFYVEAKQTMQAHLAVLFPNYPHQLESGQTEPVIPATHYAGDWITRLGAPANREPNSAYQRIADLRVSTTDPDATLMSKKGGGGVPYSSNLSQSSPKLARAAPCGCVFLPSQSLNPALAENGALIWQLRYGPGL